jgi:mannose-6-phosphate isomerase-like protein (cupin superfamily)
MGHRLLGALFSVTVVLSSVAANAQSRQPSVVRVEAGAIDSAFRSIATTPAEFAREFAVEDKTQYQFVVLSRSTTGPAELHDDWSDIIIVRSGSAILQTGMRLLETKLADKGEWRGTAIADAKNQVVRAGDVLIIPAGIAHQWQPEGEIPFSYIILKVHLARPAP